MRPITHHVPHNGVGRVGLNAEEEVKVVRESKFASVHPQTQSSVVSTNEPSIVTKLDRYMSHPSEFAVFDAEYE